MKDEEKTLAICGSTDRIVTKGQKTSCDHCGVDIWLSDSTIESVSKFNKKKATRDDLLCLCFFCGLVELKNNPPEEFIKYTKKQQEEVDEIKDLVRKEKYN